MGIAEQEAVFNAAQYVLDIPELDGYKADKLLVAFGGGIELDRTSGDDLDFVNGLELGREVTITVTGTVTRKGFTYAVGKDDEPGQAGYGVSLKVHTLDSR